MIFALLACTPVPAPESERMDLDGPCRPTPDRAGRWYGWPEFVDGGDLQGEGKLELERSSVDGVMTGSLGPSGAVTVKGVPIKEGHGWQIDLAGSSCWGEDTGADLTTRLGSPVVDTAAGWIEATAGSGLGDAWFLDGDVHEYVLLDHGPDADPLLRGPVLSPAEADAVDGRPMTPPGAHPDQRASSQSHVAPAQPRAALSGRSEGGPAAAASEARLRGTAAGSPLSCARFRGQPRR